MSRMPETVSDALDYVRREWANGHLRPIRLDELAAAASVSTGHFARVFRSHYNLGAATALERLRLARAASMLLRTSDPLRVVATECGFADPYHFSRRFSATYGMPPGRYRRQVTSAEVMSPLADVGLAAMAAALWPPTSVEQVVNTSAPPRLRPGRTYGQSFTIPFGLRFTEVRFLLATYGSATSGVTVALYQGTPDALPEPVAASRIEPMTDNTTEWLRIAPLPHGRYYLELSEPVGTPTWWWHQGTDVAAIGGRAHIDRIPVQHTNFVFAATATGPDLDMAEDPDEGSCQPFL
ncbi:helix-turn-helix domain-containing protein [Actinopolymorpha singaporensis]